MMDLAQALYIVCYLVGIVSGLAIGYVLFMMYYMNELDIMLKGFMGELYDNFYKKDHPPERTQVLKLE